MVVVNTQISTLPRINQPSRSSDGSHSVVTSILANWISQILLTASDILYVCNRRRLESGN